MKAVFYEKYGGAGVLEIRETGMPVPKDNEVLIKVIATSVTAGDWRMRKAKPFLARLYNGLFKPKKVKILGFELAGRVENTGKKVSKFHNGDEVFAFCGFTFGAYAEYRCLPENGFIALKPVNMAFEEAATVPVGGLSALNLLKKGQIEPWKKVLIYGASGSVGTFSVQLAKHFGAEVTAVCSGRNTDLVRSIGADETIDYTNQDFTQTDKKFDIIMDAVGKIKKSQCKNIMEPGSRYISVKGNAKLASSDMLILRDLIEAGALKSVIDRVYNLSDIREAHRYVEQFHKRGNVAVRVSTDH